MIKGVIYDLDGTIISTTKLHEDSWREAGKHYNIEFTDEFLRNQKGSTDEASAKEVLGSRYDEHGKRFIQLKRNHTVASIKHSDSIELFEDFLEASKELQKRNITEWICTSAPKEFVAAVFDNISPLRSLEDKTVYREMSTHGKPDPEPIFLTANLMGLPVENCVYVGDAYNDYLASKSAGCGFVYFCSNPKDRDPRIPENIPVISNHVDLLPIIESF